MDYKEVIKIDFTKIIIQGGKLQMKSNETNERLYDVTVKGERFENVPSIPKFQKCSSSNCKHYWSCSNNGVLKKSDCKKSTERAKTIYHILTGIVVVFTALLIYNTANLGFIKGTAYFLIFLVLFDMICWHSEKFVSFLIQNRFYKNLKTKLLERENSKKKQEEELRENLKELELSELKPKQIDEYRKNAKYIYLVRAENSINILREFSSLEYLGESGDKLIICVSKLYEILKELKKDMNEYEKFENILDIYLPGVYLVLKAYEIRKKNNQTVEEHDKAVKDCVNMLYTCLHCSKDCKNESVRKQFTAFIQTTLKILN